MNKITLAIIVFSCFISGAATAESGAPDYVKSAKSDVGSALMANIFKRADFSCEALQAKDKTWTLGCFVHEKNPMPFLLFTVTPDPEKTNPPFDYKVHALNGKAKQYASNDALQMFKIDEVYNNVIDISALRDEYVETFVK
ncbi:hypothetical protein [Pantoea sp. NGS-ED-1003]|uniref:hypothetical protein n=1 Tax=Pantoea sp. NGS-ED-1003 TaxID=1526743 RepID=UPI001268EAB0|nr:hypothetical protein [Pantoea sp. NGS-ED-1003]